jgi:hypothetical protein
MASSLPQSKWQVSTSDTSLLNVYLVGPTQDGHMFSFTFALTFTKVMVAKMEVSFAGDMSICIWAKFYCIKCELEDPYFNDTITVKDIKYLKTGYLYLAVQVDTATKGKYRITNHNKF